MCTRTRYIYVVLALSFVFSVQLPAATTLYLTAVGSSGFVNGAYFVQADPQPTGTGYIQSFVRLSTNNDIEQGYNTDGRKLEFDENSSPQFTRSLAVSDLCVVTMDDTTYWQFLLDINQTARGPGNYLSLDGLEVYLGATGDLLDYPNLGTKVFDLDANADNAVVLDYNLGSGSGSGDMLAYIPVPSELPADGDYLYLYSRFGELYPNNAGFEEWAAVCGGKLPSDEPLSTVPAPGALLLGGLGIAVVGYLRERQVL